MLLIALVRMIFFTDLLKLQNLHISNFELNSCLNARKKTCAQSLIKLQILLPTEEETQLKCHNLSLGNQIQNKFVKLTGPIDVFFVAALGSTLIL